MKWLVRAEAHLSMRTLRAVIPAGITDATELLDVLANQLRFPVYFGRNWDALFDCLCDFSWLSEPTQIVIQHEDVPCLPTDQHEVYLKVLCDAVDSWRLEPAGHKLHVSFSEADIARRVNGKRRS